MRKRVVYVTGCLGFIGYHVTQACLNRGWYVLGVDKGTYCANWNLLANLQQHQNFKFIASDINDLERLVDCDYVINTAAETHVDNSIVSSKVFLESNINGVHHLLELIKQKRLFTMPVMLHFSTDEVYGDIEVGAHFENDLLKPSNPYAATKAAADHLVTSYGRTYGVPYIILRPTNNYGIGQYVEKLIPKSVKYLSLGRCIDIHQNGTPRRTWLHVSDTANAVLAVIDAGVKNEIYNISGNHECANIEVINKIVRQIKGTSDNIEQYLEHMTRPGQDVRYAIDDTKLQKLDWRATAQFDNELANIVKYYQDNFVW